MLTFLPNTYYSQKQVFRGFQAVFSPRDHEHRVRGAILHLLVVGNLWEVMLNLFPDLFSGVYAFLCFNNFPGS